MNNQVFEKITQRSFFTCPAEELAQNLLGKVLCHRVGDKTLRFLITETEAYGKDDPFCHSNNYQSGNGVDVQKMQGGTIYVHYRPENEDGSMFDIVSGKEGEGESVLIRAALDLNALAVNEFNLIVGPRKLGYAIKMKYENNKKDLLNSDDIWLEEIHGITICIDDLTITKKARHGLSISEKNKKQKEEHKDDKLNFSIISGSA